MCPSLSNMTISSCSDVASAEEFFKWCECRFCNSNEIEAIKEWDSQIGNT